MNVAKPFEISKKLVWQAYLEVKSNGGAAGVDKESIEAFEQNLKKNLYRLWNRLSSGSYFPPSSVCYVEWSSLSEFSSSDKS